MAKHVRKRRWILLFCSCLVGLWLAFSDTDKLNVFVFSNHVTHLPASPSHSTDSDLYSVSYSEESAEQGNGSLTFTDVTFNPNPDICFGPRRVIKTDALASTFSNLNLALRIYDADVTPDFRAKLKSALSQINQQYQQLVGSKHFSSVTYVLEVYGDIGEFQNALAKTGYQGSLPLGVYSPADGKALVLFQNNKQLFRTALHEYVHALNHANIGVTPYWINEGLAEYFENISYSTVGGEVPMSQQWVNGDNQFEETFFDLSALFGQEEYWYKYGHQTTTELYANAWLWSYYLMTEPKRRKVMAALLAKEREKPCSAEDNDELFELMLEKQHSIEADIYEWLEIHLAIR
ncbi:hypothetical protein CS022_13175 [Veronia nyctiphanis]|uniref:DUF1570 domain-containing protein n=1 Tax=Veronia nyctiphanis TaxID=1278244 RepID=A0A4Q0YP73_9GAMM|nr:hypothetical protein [Veronia nyctiphanis]RXJ72810.1 hypothetical protein CS022_13175 [Veronia nyctiphanis]